MKETAKKLHRKESISITIEVLHISRAPVKRTALFAETLLKLGTKYRSMGYLSISKKIL